MVNCCVNSRKRIIDMVLFCFLKKTPVKLENGVLSWLVPDLNAGDNFVEIKYVLA